MIRLLLGALASIPLVIAGGVGFWDHPVAAAGPLLFLLPLAWLLRNRSLESPHLIWLAAALGAAIAASLSAQIPVSVDGEVYQFQAGLLASGHLGAGPYPWPEFFHYYFVVPTESGQLFGAFPPGWPAALAPAVWLGAAWLLNPALSGLLVLLTARLSRLALPNRPGAAVLAAFLIALSPMTTGLGGSFMSHVLAACLTLGALIWVWRPLTPPRALACGVLLGWLFVTRPLNGLLLAPLIAALALLQRPRLPSLVVGILATGLVGSLYLVTNQIAFGDPLQPGQTAYFDRTEPQKGCHRLGFGPDIGCVSAHNLTAPGYTPADAIEVTFTRLRALGAKGLGPGLALVLPLLLLMRPPKSAPPSRLWPLAALGLLTLLGYALFYFHGNFFGPRLFYEALPAIAILVAAAATDAGWWAIALSLGGLLGGQVAVQLDAEGYRWMPYAEVTRLVQAAPGDQKLIFVDGHILRGRARWTHDSLGMVLGDLPSPTARLIFAHDLGPTADQALVEAYPQHVPYLLRLDPEGDLSDPFKASLIPSLRPLKTAPSDVIAMPLVARFPLRTRPDCAFAEPHELSPGVHALRISTRGPCTVDLGPTPPGDGPWQVSLRATTGLHAGRFEVTVGAHSLGILMLQGPDGQRRTVPLGITGPGEIRLHGLGTLDLLELRFRRKH